MSRATSITSDINGEKEDNKIICEALGCKNKPNEKLMVKVGKFGYIEISLCKNCKVFFDNLNKNIESIDENRQSRNQQVAFN